MGVGEGVMNRVMACGLTVRCFGFEFVLSCPSVTLRLRGWQKDLGKYADGE